MKKNSQRCFLLIVGILFSPMAFSEETTSQEEAAFVPCAATGSSNVFVEGKPQLRLSDVQSCDPRSYEIIPSVFVNGEPAIRLLENPATGRTSKGAKSVTIGGNPASRAGDKN